MIWNTKENPFGNFQLVCLIILFFIATFIPDWLFMGHQGEQLML